MERENVVFAMRAQQDGRRIRWEQMWTLAGRVFEGRRREHRRAQDREGMEETNELQREFNIGTCDLSYFVTGGSGLVRRLAGMRLGSCQLSACADVKVSKVYLLTKILSAGVRC